MRRRARDLTIATVRLALAISGSDPTGGAGLQADLRVFQSLGIHGAGVVTAITIQDTERVHRVLPMFPTVVLEQLRVLLRDITPDAVKVGMLASDDVALNVELGLRELEGVPIVVDPVLAASDGTPLLERRAWERLRELIGRADIATPNRAEAAALTGTDVSTEQGVEAAAGALVSHLGARAALVTGGDAEGPPRDLLAVREGGTAVFHWMRGRRVACGRVHGTGCALASAIAAGLARGEALEPAVRAARDFVADALARSAARGKAARFLVYD